MSKLFTTLRSQAAQYNFNGDGGAVSTIGLGIFIPAFATIKSFIAKVLTAPTSGGAATISFGLAASTQFFMVTTGIAGFVINTVVPGVDFNANPTISSLTVTQEVNIVIAGAALTAGRIVVVVSYDELDV